MTTVRQDAWTADEDLLLAEVVLRHIREGSTQLKAFEEVGKELSRTSAACGFRWNSFVRKQYASAIEMAKQQRKRRKQHLLEEASTSLQHEEACVNGSKQEPSTFTLEESRALLVAIADSLARYQQETEGAHILQEELNRLRQENQRLMDELEHMKADYQEIDEDYRSLVEILEKARKLVVPNETDSGSDMDK